MSGRHVRPAAADRGHMLPSACHALRLDTCLPGRLHHDDGEKARPFPCGKRRQGRFSCLMTCRGQEANGFQQHNHFKRRRVWRIGRTTRLPTRRPAVWQNDLSSVPHRSSSVLSLRSCLAGGFSRNFCSADRINPCSSAMRRISRMLLWTARSVTISVRTGRSTPCPLQRTVLSAIRRCSAKARPDGSLNEYVKKGKEVDWKVYQKQPDNVFFSHAVHSLATCNNCHEFSERELCSTCHLDMASSKKPPVFRENRIPAATARTP